MALDGTRRIIGSKLRLALALGGALSSSVAIGQTAPHPAARGPMTMDVAGVRLGMSMAQAGAAATAAGYRCRPFGTQFSFKQKLEGEIAKRRRVDLPFFRAGAGTAELRCDGQNGEGLQLHMAETSSGTVVDRMRLYIAGSTTDLAAVRTQLAAKYGRPTVGTLNHGSWCDPGQRCTGAPDVAVFSIDINRDVLILADRGRPAGRADEAALMAAADRVAPKRGSAAF